MGRITDIVKHLLIINVIFFFASTILGEIMYDLFAMHYPNNPNFFVWQPITHMFMHGDLTHIMFNMFGLWMFGTPLEQIWGKKKFIFFYISAGLGAALLQITVYHIDIVSVNQILSEYGLSKGEIDLFYETGRLNTSLIQSVGEDRLFSGIQSFKALMVGASGALYGILVAFAMLFPNVQLMLLFPPIPVKAKYLVPILILFDLFFGFTSYSVGPIAHFAHIGGAITGFIMMWYWKKNNLNNKRWDL
jgi:membrane associated rhomboid family serine protease|tara:strand:- start:3518 stop:4258 length:741 start_codon:yes stop_codon:yes gene_type:complete